MVRFTKRDVQLEKVEPVYKGYFKINRYHFKHKLYSGEQSNTVVREVFERGHAVAVVPYDPITNEIVLIEQFRYPAVETTEFPWMIEVVAGIIDPGESLEDVCYREAQEEAGIEISNLIPVHSFMASSGACTERIHLFAAQVDASTAHGIHGLEHEAEDIKVIKVNLDDIPAWLNEGRVENATALIALQWMLLNKQRLLDLWAQR